LSLVAADERGPLLCYSILDATWHGLSNQLQQKQQQRQKNVVQITDEETKSPDASV
jgi:transposase